MSEVHERGRAAFRRGDYAEAERLAREAYEQTANPHSRLNEMVARYAQGKLSKTELDVTIHDLGLEGGGHGRSVLARGY
ncbi:MAG: hypothetical protein V3T17_00585 [Pseudomonadales bacterium]